MLTRTREATVTFVRPFRLAELDAPQPAGTYRVVTDEEEILGLSMLAYRRVATALHLPAIEAGGDAARPARGPAQVFLVDPAGLEAALAADARS
jgi:hypothetical protein